MHTKSVSGKPQGLLGLPGRPRQRWKDNIKMGLRNKGMRVTTTFNWLVKTVSSGRRL
jgi:hypothetical protein